MTTLLHSGPPTLDDVSRWLELANAALYQRSDNDLEDLVVELEQVQIDMIRQEARSATEREPEEPETFDDLIDEDPDDDEDEEIEPFQSLRRVTRTSSELLQRLSAVRRGSW